MSQVNAVRFGAIQLSSIRPNFAYQGFLDNGRISVVKHIEKSRVMRTGQHSRDVAQEQSQNGVSLDLSQAQFVNMNVRVDKFQVSEDGKTARRVAQNVLDEIVFTPGSAPIPNRYSDKLEKHGDYFQNNWHDPVDVVSTDGDTLTLQPR